jgi:hypothetical protein
MSAATPVRRRLLKAAAALPVMPLAGCVVTPYGPYRRPSAEHPSVRYKGAWCNGVAGPPAVIELTLAPGVLLSAAAQRDYVERDRPELPLRITLTLPPTPARFADDRLQVLAGGKAVGSAPQVSVFRYARLPADAWIDPVRVRPSGAVADGLAYSGPYGSATLQFSVGPGFTADRIVVEGVAIDQAGRRIALPTFEMTRPVSERSKSDFTSAAMQARLRARVAECQREVEQRGSKRDCAAIVDYAPHSFDLDEPEARFHGRFYRFDGRADQPLNGEVIITPKRPERWRLASSRIDIVDVANGSRRTAALERISVAVSDRVALDTALFAGPVDGTGDARMSVEVLLPGSTGDFELQLPALLLGAQRIDVPSIRFDKRSFDGGIEPFNC